MECEQKNPIEKPFKFCIHWSVTLCAEHKQKNLIESHSSFAFFNLRFLIVLHTGASFCAWNVNDIPDIRPAHFDG